MPKERRSRPGLEVVARPGTRALYLRGTVRGQRIYESTGTDDRGLAEEARAAREAELYRSAIHGTKPTMTFAAAALAYLQHEPRAECIKRAIGRLVAHLGARITCDKIDQDVIDTAGKVLCRATSKPITRDRQVVSPAKAILNFAARRGRCDPPKFESIKSSGKRTDWLTPAEAERMVAAASEHFRPLLVFLLCTGGRLGEVLELEWSHVNLQHARVVFRGEKDDGSRGTKSGDDRVVELPPRAVVALANISYRLRRKRDKEDPAAAREDERKGRVFRRPNGDAYRSTNNTKAGASGGQIKRAFATALKNAKIGRRLTPHHCRHTWATWHYAVYHDLLKLRDDGAWHSVSMVERYAKLAPPSMRDEVLAFWGIPTKQIVQVAPVRAASA